MRESMRESMLVQVRAMNKPYVYVLVRLDISPEQQIVQAGHAALEAGFAFSHPGQTASLIVLEVKDKDELLAASAHLQGCGIEHQLFFEPDFNMGYSAIATRPVFGSERNLFRKWRLFRRREAAMR